MEYRVEGSFSNMECLHTLETAKGSKDIKLNVS